MYTCLSIPTLDLSVCCTNRKNACSRYVCRLLHTPPEEESVCSGLFSKAEYSSSGQHLCCNVLLYRRGSLPAATGPCRSEGQAVAISPPRSGPCRLLPSVGGRVTTSRLVQSSVWGGRSFPRCWSSATQYVEIPPDRQRVLLAATDNSPSCSPLTHHGARKKTSTGRSSSRTSASKVSSVISGAQLLASINSSPPRDLRNDAG